MNEQYLQKGTSAFNKANFALFVAAFITFANLYIAQPLLPTFSEEFNVSPTVSSLSLSLNTLSLAFGLLIFGSLSEAWGRKNMMTVSIFAASILTIVIAFSPTFEALLLLRILQGIVFAGVPSIAMAYLGEEIEKKSIGIAMGLCISGNSLGGLSGRMLMGTMTDFFSWQVGMIVLGIISLLASIYFVYALPPSKHFVAKPLKLKSLFMSFMDHLKNPLLLALFFIPFFLMGSFVTIYNYLGYKLTEAPYFLSLTIVGFLFIIYLVGTFSSTWFGVLGDKYGHTKFLILGTALFSFGILMTLPTHLFFKIGGLVILTFGFFGAHSIASGMVSRHATHNKAQASSLYLFAYYFGSSLGGTVGGIFWSNYGWNGVVGFTLGLVLCAGAFVMYVHKKSVQVKSGLSL